MAEISPATREAQSECEGGYGMMRGMGHRLPVSALLSFALVAFTVEADNEAEHRLPHRTTRGGSATGGGSLADFDSDVVQLHGMGAGAGNHGT